MATLYVAEFDARNSSRLGQHYQCYAAPPLTTYTLAIGAGNVQHPSVFLPDTKLIWLSADTPCLIDVGTNPDATAGSWFVPSNIVVPINVDSSLSHRIAVTEAPAP